MTDYRSRSMWLEQARHLRQETDRRLSLRPAPRRRPPRGYSRKSAGTLVSSGTGVYAGAGTSVPLGLELGLGEGLGEGLGDGVGFGTRKHDGAMRMQ